MSIKVMNGSNRATCRICHKIIEKGSMNQVQFFAWKISENYHRDCIRDWEKIKMLEALE